MLSAAELKFSTRESGGLPAWLTEKSLRIWPLPEAKTVTLRLKGLEVLVKVRERSSILVGEISGFQPGISALAGLHVGDLIVFTHSHIFAASD